MDELVKNELVLEEDDDKDDGLIVDVMSPTENLEQIEEEDKSDDEIKGNSFFKQSSEWGMSKTTTGKGLSKMSSALLL